jgi:glucoamylase
MAETTEGRWHIAIQPGKARADAVESHGGRGVYVLADVPQRRTGDHPWAVSTANFAELYYRLATQITTTGTVPLDDLSASFFSQVGVDASTAPPAAAEALRNAGGQVLQAIVFHSDHLELSEQFDATTGYEKSVSNLSWSYASFLSAVRSKNAS